MAKIRPRERFSREQSLDPNPIWEALEFYFKGYLLNPRPPESMAEFPYLASIERPSSFRLIKGHQRLKHGRAKLDRFFGSKALELGPVEAKVLSFIIQPNSYILLLEGGMGSGKSTTLRYLAHHFLPRHTCVIFCDLERLLSGLQDAPSEERGEADARWALAEVIDTSLARHHLLSLEDEFLGMWPWALSDTLDLTVHPAAHVLTGASRHLLLRHGPQWRPDAPEVLETLHLQSEELKATSLNWLRYLLLQIDYYLTVKCEGDRSRLVIILDNADPLPPIRQRAFLSVAQQLASQGNCKIILSLRPLTYNIANVQAASKIISVVEQHGPDVVDVIVNRMRQFLSASDEEILRRAYLDEQALPLEGYEESTGRISLDLQGMRHWVSEMLSSLTRTQSMRHAVPAALGEPNAREFIEGASGQSLRSGLLLAQKLFASSLPPLGATLGSEGSPQRKRGIRDQELIRAVLLHDKPCYQAAPSRIIDNLFDSGRGESRGNLTCKLRLLYRLKTATVQGRRVDELQWYLRLFGFSPKTILSAINMAISEYKRLAWCDSCVVIHELEQESHAHLSLADAGRFYLRYAIFNLVYIQEVHVDCMLPEEHVVEFDPQRFEERMRSVELFLRYLHDIDKAETLHIIHEGERERYLKVHGRTLFTLEMLTTLERQVTRVASAMAEGSGAERKRHLNDVIERWQAFLAEAQHGSRDVLRGLNGEQP